MVREAEASVPTRFGDFRFLVFSNDHDATETVAIVRGDVARREHTPLRLHVECALGDTFGSLACDCRQRLDDALAAIGERNEGLVVYLRKSRNHALAASVIGSLDVASVNLLDGADPADAEQLRRHGVSVS